MFAGFCLCIAAYVSAGLVGGKLNTKPQQPQAAAAAAEARFKPLSWRDVAWYVSMTFVGGIIVGYISVGAGKVLFWSIPSVFQLFWPITGVQFWGGPL